MPNLHPKKNRPTPDIEKSSAEKHLGIIAQRAHVYWRRLPAGARNYYDIDDMIADVVLHIWKRASSYNPKRAQESTWVWRVADNRCKEICAHYLSQKYTACGESDLLIDLLETRETSQEHCIPHRGILPANRDAGRLREACEAVERMIEFGSDAVQDLLEQILCGHLRSRPSPDTVVELKACAKKHSVRLRDLEMVYRYATGE